MKLTHRFFAAVIAPTGLYAAAASAQAPATPTPVQQPAPGQVIPVQQPPAGQPAPAGQATPATPARPQAQAQANDALIGNCLAISARACEQMTEIAQAKVQSDDVKSCLRDKAERAKKLSARLAELGYRGQAGVIAPAPGTTATAVAPAATNLPPGAEQALNLEREVAEQCVASFRTHAEKAGAKGREFDAAVVGMGLAESMMAKNKLTVFQKHTTGELRQVVDQELSAVEKDMKDLKTAMEKIDERRTEKAEKN